MRNVAKVNIPHICPLLLILIKTKGDFIMKNSVIKLSVLLLIFSLFAACSKNQFMDPGGFVYAFNRVSDEEIEFEDVYIYNEGSDGVFEIFFDDDDPSVVMKLITENDRIKQIRIAIARIDGNGQPFIPSTETVREFIEITESAIRVYCGYDKAKAESVLKNFGLYNMENYSKDGELTFNDGDFSFVYYADSFVCDFMISNAFLHKTETTEKPQSKPAYGNTTNLRGETTPLPTFKH